MTTWDLTPSRDALIRRLLDCFTPPERLKASEWAVKRRRMSAESSSKKGGRFSFQDFPWQVEPMDAPDDPTVRSVVLIWPSQVAGKTETINNMIGAKIDIDPCPMLVLQPNEKPMAEDWSKGKFAPMLRDTPSLSALVRDPRGRDSGNTLLRKSFPGGFISIAGANSPSSLASRSIRMVFFDEVDRYPASAGTEGDPIALATKRTASFPDAVTVITSTPTIKGASRVEKEFEASDKRRWFCPCPTCGHWQTLVWEQVDFSVNGTVEDPRYICSSESKCVLTDPQRQQMVRAGEWRATAPFRGVRGYHINGIYCLLRPARGFKNRLAQMVTEFLSENSKGVETLKVWWNTFKAETWEDPSEKPPAAEELLERCEDYLTKNDDGTVTIPEGVLCITVGADRQKDRVEMEFVGWGFGEESWGLGSVVVAGDTALPETWERVDAELNRKFLHPSGAVLTACAAFIDRGYEGKTVDDFTRPRNSRFVWSCYGSSSPGKSIISTLTRQGKGTRRTSCYPVGTDTAKGVLYSWLKLTRPGPHYMHFPVGFGYDLEFFQQLVSERLVTKWEDGALSRKWQKTRARNEALDNRVYGIAAMEARRPNFDALAKNLNRAPAKEYVLKQPDTQPHAEPKPQTPPARRPARRSGGFVGGWRK
jgi:phage terminase large subunit GpA-like protein